ncbi:MAG TPA: TIGR01777 family oxidoreductase [Xanthobacteraceae bacterium]|nr:TIGR01777 family oxidoreductase [Xanthobacteraceae bacterium]
MTVLTWLRDTIVARRKKRIVSRVTPSDAAALVDALAERQHLLVTGATGFIGMRLVEALTSAGHDVTVLARDPAKATALRAQRVVTDLAQIPDDARIDAVINFAGEPTGNALWTRRKRRKILSSRLRVTRAVNRLIARLALRPAVVISGSAIGWYGLWQDETLTEFDGGKRCFSHRVCDTWEREARKAQRLGVRVVRLRIGLVLGLEGGPLSQYLVPFELGLGGPVGSGRQWMSWIERDDLVRLIAHIIATPSLTGAVNATAPAPVRNEEFAHALAGALRRPALLRMPAAILHYVAGAFADELMLGGQRVIPDKALLSGFVFRYENLRGALDAMLGNASARPMPAVKARSVPVAEQPVDQPAVEAPARLLRSLRAR